LRVLSVVALVVLVAVGIAAAVELFTGWWILALLGGVVAAALLAAALRRRVAGRTVLEIDLARGIVEQTPADPVGRAMARRAYVLRDLVDALDRAAGDRRVVGLLARIDAGEMGVARAQELSSAVARFAASGKPAVAYAETLGELGGRALPEMAVAAAFGEFYLQPASDLGITGIDARGPFLGGMFAKAGIVPSFDHRHEYKAAKYRLTDDHMPEPAREAAAAVVGDQFDQLVAAIAADRELREDAVRAAVDRAPLLAAEAKDAGLVDDLLYRDEVFERMKALAGKQHRRLDAAAYLKRAGRVHRRGKTIALVYGTGAVKRGSSGFDPLTRPPGMGSDDVTRALREAIDDKSVKAIVFRIDSPGGSAVASEAIWRETVRAAEQGKPVVATMGDVAGSGGYYVAVGCRRIVARPGTVTGSIGVVFGKLVVSGAWAKFGVAFDGVTVGESAGFSSSLQDYSPVERERVDAILDDIYDRFVGVVAAGRGLEPSQVHEIAKGRIWSGQAAKDLGLVDELGGMPEAFELARREAGLDRYKVALFPARRPALAQLLHRSDKGLDTLEAVLRAAEPVADAAAEMNLGVLQMPGRRARL